MTSNTNKENANFSSSASIKFTAIRVSTLLTSPDLDQLNDLVNAAYMSMGHPWPAIGLLEGERYIHPRVEFRTQLVDEIGPDSFMVICRDESVSYEGPIMFINSKTSSSSGAKPISRHTNSIENINSLSSSNTPGSDSATAENITSDANADYRQDTTTTKRPRIVAVAALKPFKQKTVYAYKRRNGTMSQDLLPEEQRYSETDNWEISTCATVEDARYRGTGLISRCMNMLIEQVQKQRKQQGEKRPLKLWSTALCGTSNPDYWRKRRFVNEGEKDAAPAGVWSSKHDFEIQTLGKMIDWQG